MLTGARAPVTLHLSRILHSQGVNVFLADSINYPISAASNSVQHFFLLPSPKFHTGKFLNVLNQVIKKNNIDLIIPTCEETFYLSMLIDKINCSIFTDKIETLHLLHNKLNFINFVERLGYQVPVTISTNNQNLVKNQLKELLFNEIVLKPIYSRFSDSVSFTTKKEILKSTSSLKPNWIVQQRIKGTQYCSYSVVEKGKIVAHTVYKTAFTAGLGASISFKHEDIPFIYEFTKDVVSELNYSGQIAFDFIKDSNGCFYPLECNPRATSGLHLFSGDIGNVMIGNAPSDLLTPSKDSKYAIKLALLLYGYNYWTNFSKFKLWISTLIHHTDIIYDDKDKRPYTYQFYSMYKMWKDSRKEKRSLLEQTTYDISWDGEYF